MGRLSTTECTYLPTYLAVPSGKIGGGEKQAFKNAVKQLASVMIRRCIFAWHSCTSQDIINIRPTSRAVTYNPRNKSLKNVQAHLNPKGQHLPFIHAERRDECGQGTTGFLQVHLEESVFQVHQRKNNVTLLAGELVFNYR